MVMQNHPYAAGMADGMYATLEPKTLLQMLAGCNSKLKQHTAHSTLLYAISVHLGQIVTAAGCLSCSASVMHICLLHVRVP